MLRVRCAGCTWEGDIDRNDVAGNNAACPMCGQWQLCTKIVPTPDPFAALFEVARPALASLCGAMGTTLEQCRIYYFEVADAIYVEVATSGATNPWMRVLYTKEHGVTVPERVKI